MKLWGWGAATARHRKSFGSRGSLSQGGHRPAPPHKHMGALPLSSEPRPQIHPLTTLRTKCRVSDRALSILASCPFAHALGGRSAGLAAWGLGQDCPPDRDITLAGHPLSTVTPSHHSGPSMDDTSPDRSSWPKCQLLPHHITLKPTPRLAL